MIYTSYFANLNKLPKNIIPIAICGKVPHWYTGIHYTKLAPKFKFFLEWQRNKDNVYYIREYNAQVLNTLLAQEVVYDLYRLIGIDLTETGIDFNSRDIFEQLHIALICYEAPDKFCHRHLVSGWLKEKGYPCEEAPNKHVKMEK